MRSFVSSLGRSLSFGLAVVVGALAVGTSSAADIGFVVDPPQGGQTVPTLDQPFDMFWVDRLRAQGHTVNVLGADWDPADPAVIAADIFIVSNDVGSGDFISNPNINRFFDLNPVDLTGQTNVEVTVAMAARSTGWDVGIDFVKFLADADGDGAYETELADFQPTEFGDLEFFSEGNFFFLNEQFQDVTFPVPDGIDTLRLRVEPFSTATGEQFGFDDIRITAGNTTLGAENFEGGSGQIGYTTVGEAVGDPNQFWGLSSVEGLMPDVEFTEFEGDVWFGGADVDEAFGFGQNVRLTDGRPLITYEDALFDELQLASDPATGRADDTIILIEDPDHPLAAGLMANAFGEVEIFSAPQGITFIGVAPDELGPGVQVVATNASGAAVIAVLEKDAIGFDGNPSPGMRIGFFPQDAGDGSLYTENGLALLDAAVAFALDNIPTTETLPGDYNNNGAVEQADLDLVLLNWGATADPPPVGWVADLPSGTIDQNELDGVLLNWGNTAALGNSAGVPEPSSCLLLALVGVVACAASRMLTRH